MFSMHSLGYGMVHLNAFTVYALTWSALTFLGVLVLFDWCVLMTYGRGRGVLTVYRGGGGGWG